MSDTDHIVWTNARRKLKDLVPWERNPRQIKTDQAKRLAQSFAEFGQVETIAIGPNNEVYNGHQRVNVLMDKYGPEYEVEVRVSSRALTEKEREKLTVFLHRGAAGEWDWDALSEWDVPDLLEWGFEEAELLGVDYQNPRLKEAEDVTRAREMARVLVSVPVDLAIEAKEILDELAEIDGVEILYGAN